MEGIEFAKSTVKKGGKCSDIYKSQVHRSSLIAIINLTKYQRLYPQACKSMDDPN